MKVIQDIADSVGRYPIIFSSANLKEINDWLFNNYGGEGYKFAIIVDVSKDEYEPWGSKTYAYFLDDIAGEVAAYKG